MKTTIIKPSAVRSNPERFPAETPATVRAPLGEVDTMALPIALFGLRGAVQIKPLVESDQFNAQGLEGAFEIQTTWARAFVLVQKCEDNRAVVKVKA